MTDFDQEKYERDQIVYEQQAMREQHIMDVGFVRIAPDLCAFFARHASWVEIGAGLGTLAAGIKRAGGRCVATDNFSSSYFREGDWLPTGVLSADAERSARLVARSPALGLLCSWPYGDSDFAWRALRHLRAGQLFGYIGEGAGGQTGDVAFHELLERDFEAIDTMPVESMLPNIYDDAIIYRRIRVSTPPPNNGVLTIRLRPTTGRPPKPIKPIKRHGR